MRWQPARLSNHTVVWFACQVKTVSEYLSKHEMPIKTCKKAASDWPWQIFQKLYHYIYKLWSMTIYSSHATDFGILISLIIKILERCRVLSECFAKEHMRRCVCSFRSLWCKISNAQPLLCFSFFDRTHVFHDQHISSFNRIWATHSTM